MTIYCIYPIFGVEVNEGNEVKKGKEDIVECARLYTHTHARACAFT